MGIILWLSKYLLIGALATLGMDTLVRIQSPKTGIEPFSPKQLLVILLLWPVYGIAFGIGLIQGWLGNNNNDDE
jgi:hypothetical protein